MCIYSRNCDEFSWLIIDEGTATGNKNYAAIGKIMQAYIFQVMTDLHGDIPFKDALKAGKGIIAPAYNTQQEVYDGLITLVNDGIALIDEVTTNHPGTDDFFYHGDMHQWKKFANTLKLKIYLRQVYVRSTVGAFCLPCLSIMLSIDIFVPSKRVFRMWFASI